MKMNNTNSVIKTMKALVFNKRGNPTKNILTEVECPIPGKNELLIRIMAASINAADYRVMKMGVAPKRKYFGADISGIIEHIGENVTQFKPGDEVIGDLSDFGYGGFAEFAIAPETALVKKPSNISFETAAAIPLAAITALFGLQKGKITMNQDVLIVGSSGGVGTYAVQLAKYYGANITAVCSTKNVEQARNFGANRVIDYNRDDFTQDTQSYDLILAINGNYPITAYKHLLKPNGIYIMIGGAMPQIFKSLLFGWILSFGSRKMTTLSCKSNQKDLEFLVQLVAEGHLKPVIEKRIPFEKAPEEIEAIMNGHAQGKSIIIIGKNRE